MIPVSRGMFKTAIGAIGYLIAEPSSTDGPPSSPLPSILCFHASPRCSDEFLEVLPLFAETGRKVVAMDVPGYGMSENPNQSCSIDDVADAFLEVANSLDVDKFIVLGNLMGDFVGTSLASRYPDRVVGNICANLYYFPPEAAAKARQDSAASKKEGGEPIPDNWELKEDGSHLVDIHNKRKWLDPELNVRVVQGELTYLINRRARYEKGISIEDLNEYDFETPAKKVTCPTLCIKGEQALGFFDMIGYSGTKQFEAGCQLFSNCEVATLSGSASTINMINQVPEEFAKLCIEFLQKHKL